MKTMQLMGRIFIMIMLMSLSSFCQSSKTDSASKAFIVKVIKKIKKDNPYRTLDTLEVNKLIAISKKINYTEGEARLTFFKSIKMMQSGASNEVITLLKPIVERSGSRELDSIKVFCCVTISEAGLALGDYYLSLQYLEKAAALNAASETAELAMAMHNAHIWALLPEKPQLNNFHKALQYCVKAERIAKRLDNKRNLSMSLVNSGMLYSHLKLWEAANAKFREAIEIAKENNLPQITQLALLGTAEMHYEKGDYARALKKIKESKSIIQSSKPIQYTEVNLWQIATLLKLKDYKTAESIIDTLKSRSIADERKLYRYKSDLYYATGLYKESLDNYKKHIAIQDSIAGISMMQELNYLDYKYKVVEKDKNILESKLQLNQKNSLLRKQRYWLFASISTALLIAMGAAILYIRHTNKQKLKAKENELHIMQSYFEGELQERKRIAMDLHDSLGGVVSSIRLKFELAMMENFSDQEEIGKMKQLITNAATSVREIAHNLNPPELNYSDLSTALKNYCASISTQSQLNITVDAAENITLNKIENLEIFAAIKELIHNIIKHADASLATITITQEKMLTTIVVSDNGKGYDLRNPNAQGSGLTNVKNRIERLNGSLKTKSCPEHGTEVVILINGL